MNGSETPASKVVATMFDDLAKSTITLPLEGCKTMGVGCVQVSTVYGAITAFVNAGHQPHYDDWRTYVILLPFLLWAYAGLRFGMAYLPNVRLTTLLGCSGQPPDEGAQRAFLLARENEVRKEVSAASAVFWIGLVIAVFNIALIHLKQV